MKKPAAEITVMSRTAIRAALKTPGYVMLQFHERHGIPLRTIWRMRRKKTDYPPTQRTLRRFSEAIAKDRADGILRDAAK